MSDITSNFTESKSPNDSKDTFVDSKETEEMQDEDGELVLSHQEAMSKVEASINEIISVGLVFLMECVLSQPLRMSKKVNNK